MVCPSVVFENVYVVLAEMLAAKLELSAQLMFVPAPMF
jgi:hypothetical protein